MTSRLPGRARRILLGLAILVGTITMALYIVLPLGMAVVAVAPAHRAVGVPPAGADAVELTTSDGLHLYAWYLPPKNGIAVILLHGAGGSRHDLLPYIQMLSQSGYGVLAMDARGHGTSEGHTNRLGWAGTADIGAAVAFLRTHREVQHIAGLGLSMGGEMLLGAADAYSEIEALIADGASRRCLAELLALPSERPLVRNWTARVMYAGVQFLSGERPPHPLLAAMQAAPHTRFLFIAAGQKELKVQFNQLFAQTLGERATLWVIEDVPHTGGLSHHPEAYREQVLTFLDTCFSDNGR